MLSARRAAALTRELESIPHVKVIRWHTRMPVADPARVSDELVSAIRTATKAVYVAVHCNHANELSPLARAALARLADASLCLVTYQSKHFVFQSTRRQARHADGKSGRGAGAS